jgi:hypothetical protein
MPDQPKRVFDPLPDTGTPVRFVNDAGNDINTGFSGGLFSYGWATRKQSPDQTVEGFPPESMDVVAVGNSKAARALGEALKGISLDTASSSGISTKVLVVFVDDNGLQTHHEYKFALVSNCVKATPHPKARELVFCDSSFSSDSMNGDLKKRAEDWKSADPTQPNDLCDNP